MFKQWVHLVSCEYSGSTLLSFVLASHPKISSVGELVGWTSPDYKCSCGNIMKECPFWTEVQKKMILKGYDYDFYNAKLNISPYFQKGFLSKTLYYFYFYVFKSPSLERFRDLFFRIFLYPWYTKIVGIFLEGVQLAQSISEVEGSEIFFDATKDHFRLKLLKDFCEAPVKVIHLVRDGKAVVNSFVKRGHSYQRAINHWVQKNQIVENLKRHFSSSMDFYLLRYEDLCSRPSETLSKISSFLGIEDDFRLSSFNPENYHIIGNSMRLKFDGSIREPKNDTSLLTKRMEKDFELAAHELYRKYGYL